jgi:hypothetical protein
LIAVAVVFEGDDVVAGAITRREAGDIDVTQGIQSDGVALADSTSGTLILLEPALMTICSQFNPSSTL